MVSQDAPAITSRALLLSTTTPQRAPRAIPDEAAQREVAMAVVQGGARLEPHVVEPVAAARETEVEVAAEAAAEAAAAAEAEASAAAVEAAAAKAAAKAAAAQAETEAAEAEAKAVPVQRAVEGVDVEPEEAAVEAPTLEPEAAASAEVTKHAVPVAAMVSAVSGPPPLPGWREELAG
jgi:hypothetical protein